MRKQDWEQQLEQFIESRRGTPHKWGSNDCCLFAADAVLAITGEDKAAALRGTYHSQGEALEIIAKHGDLTGLISSFLGEPLGPLCARNGDIVLFKGRNGEAVGVCTGTHFVCPGDNELIVFPMAGRATTSALKAWKVD